MITNKKNKNLFNKRRFKIFISRSWFILKVSLLGLVLIFLFTNSFNSLKNTLWKFYSENLIELGFKTQKIAVNGVENSDLTYDDIIKFTNKDKKSIFDLDLKLIANNIKKDPWVKDINVIRKIPNNLIINIVEHKPLAIWQYNQKLSIINHKGDIITNKNIGKFSYLIQVIGEDANLNADILINNLKSNPFIMSKVKHAIRYGKRRWNLMLEDNIIVKMPEKNFIKAYKYLEELNNKNSLFNKKIKSIDLRDKQKYYIEER